MSSDPIYRLKNLPPVDFPKLERIVTTYIRRLLESAQEQKTATEWLIKLKMAGCEADEKEKRDRLILYMVHKLRCGVLPEYFKCPPPPTDPLPCLKEVEAADAVEDSDEQEPDPCHSDSLTQASCSEESSEGPPPSAMACPPSEAEVKIKSILEKSKLESKAAVCPKSPKEIINETMTIVRNEGELEIPKIPPTCVKTNVGKFDVEDFIKENDVYVEGHEECLRQIADAEFNHATAVMKALVENKLQLYFQAIQSKLNENLAKLEEAEELYKDRSKCLTANIQRDFPGFDFEGYKDNPRSLYDYFKEEELNLCVIDDEENEMIDEYEAKKSLLSQEVCSLKELVETKIKRNREGIRQLEGCAPPDDPTKETEWLESRFKFLNKIKDELKPGPCAAKSGNATI